MVDYDLAYLAYFSLCFVVLWAQFRMDGARPFTMRSDLYDALGAKQSFILPNLSMYKTMKYHTKVFPLSTYRSAYAVSINRETNNQNTTKQLELEHWGGRTFSCILYFYVCFTLRPIADWASSQAIRQQRTFTEEGWKNWPRKICKCTVVFIKKVFMRPILSEKIR